MASKTRREILQLAALLGHEGATSMAALRLGVLAVFAVAFTVVSIRAFTRAAVR